MWGGNMRFSCGLPDKVSKRHFGNSSSEAMMQTCG